MRGIEVEDEEKSANNYLHKMIGTAVEIIIRYSSILSSKIDSLRTISMFNVSVTHRTRQITECRN